MAKLDIQRAKGLALKASQRASEGAKTALDFADTTRKSKVVNKLLPSDHKRSRSGRQITTPIEVEEALQRQRLLQMAVVAPMMVYPLVKSRKWYNWGLALAGVVLAYTAYQQYDDTREVL